MSNFIKNIFARLKFPRDPGSSNTTSTSENIPTNPPEAHIKLSDIVLQLFQKYGKKRILLLFVLALFVVFFLGQITSNLFFSSILIMKLMIGILALFIACIVVYLLRPNWIKRIVSFLQSKLPILQYHAKQNYDKVSKNTAEWIGKFKLASNQERWVMIRKPLFFLIALFLVLKFGYLFLPPIIATSFPGNQSAEAPLDSKIETIFDKGVIKSLAEKSFSITPSVEGSFSWESDQKLIFTPQYKLNRASSYKVTFNGIVLSKIPDLDPRP